MNNKIMLSMILITALFTNGCFSWMGNVRKYEEIPDQDVSQQEVTSQKEKRLVGCSAALPTTDLSIAGIIFIGGLAVANSSEPEDCGGSSSFCGFNEQLTKGVGVLLFLSGLVPLLSGISGLSEYYKCKDELSPACNTTITPLVFPPPAHAENSSPGIGVGMTYRF